MSDSVISVFIKTYVQINEQVTLQNQDPVKRNAGLKPSLIDLEARWGDKAEPVRGRERLRRVDTER